MDQSVIAPQLVTERLKLRPLSVDDLDGFTAIAGAWAVARMTVDLPHPLSRREALAWLRPKTDDLRFGIEHNGGLIGAIGYFLHGAGTAELGFFLAPDAWGRGFAVEAARAVIGHGIASGHVTAFTASHIADNAPSARVLSKLGFVRGEANSIWCEARGRVVEAITYRLVLGQAVSAGTTTKTQAEMAAGTGS